MNPITIYELDRTLILERQAALIRSAHPEIGPIRRTAGTTLIRIGEWLRGKAEAVAEARADAAPTTLKTV